MGDVDYFQLLEPMFPNRSEAQLRDIIQIVLENQENPITSFDETIENMINLLTGDGAQGPMPDFTVSDPSRTEQIVIETFQNNANGNNDLYERLLHFFKDINPHYLLRYVREKPPGFDFDDAIDELSISKY